MNHFDKTFALAFCNSFLKIALKTKCVFEYGSENFVEFPEVYQ